MKVVFNPDRCNIRAFQSWYDGGLTLQPTQWAAATGLWRFARPLMPAYEPRTGTNGKPPGLADSPWAKRLRPPRAGSDKLTYNSVSPVVGP